MLACMNKLANISRNGIAFHWSFTMDNVKLNLNSEEYIYIKVGMMN